MSYHLSLALFVYIMKYMSFVVNKAQNYVSKKNKKQKKTKQNKTKKKKKKTKKNKNKTKQNRNKQTNKTKQSKTKQQQQKQKQTKNNNINNNKKKYVVYGITCAIKCRTRRRRVFQFSLNDLNKFINHHENMPI